MIIPYKIIICLVTTVYGIIFISMALLRIPTAVQPMTRIEGIKYQTSGVKEV